MWDIINKMLKGRGVAVVDGDEPDARLGRGTLSFGDDEPSAAQADDTVRNGLRFEVVSTRTAFDQNEKKHVAYTVLIHPANGMGVLGENPPRSAVLERRYTDFLELHASLKSWGALPPFPRKCLTGNFSSSLIAERSAAFEQLLTTVASSPRLRSCEPVTRFLSPGGPSGDPERLENEFRALDAVRGAQDRRHPAVVRALLRLVVCLDRAGQGSSAEQFADECLRRLEAASDADVLRFYVPLLQLAARLRVDRGADIARIAARMAQLRCQGVETARGPSLEQMLAATTE